MADDADTTDDEEGTSEDDTTSKENAEESRKKRHEATKPSHCSRQVKYTAPCNERGQRIRMRREKEMRCKEEDSETRGTSDSDTSVERERSERRRRRSPDVHKRSRHIRSEFTIKDVEGSLIYFTGDDKLPIEKWIAEFEDASDLLQ